MALVPSVASQSPSNEAAPPIVFLDPTKHDVDNSEFNDITLECNEGNLVCFVPCSRSILSKRSVVFADLLDYADETIFPSPFPAWLLREIRHVCYFGEFEFKDLQGRDEETTRKLCQLLVAMDYYQMDDTLSGPVYGAIDSNMLWCRGLACVVMDEFGLDNTGEVRPLVAKLVKQAVEWLEDDPRRVLLRWFDWKIGTREIRYAGTIQQILSILNTLTNANVWLEYEVLYAWANAKTNQVAAAELWEETEMLARLQADDPEYFKTRGVTAFSVDRFGWSKDFFELNQYAREKRMIATRVQRNARCASASCDIHVALTCLIYVCFIIWMVAGIVLCIKLDWIIPDFVSVSLVLFISVVTYFILLWVGFIVASIVE